MTYYRILALDGGGIRGLLSAAILERLVGSRSFMEKVDLFAGTSTGAILALGLAAGYSPSEIGHLYEQGAGRVFADTLIDDILDIGRLVGADYSLEPLIGLLHDHFEDRVLDDLQPKKVLVATFDLDNEAPGLGQRTWKPKFFHNFPGSDSDGDQRIVDVAVRSSAAPTYFPIYQGYVDGGVVANNPSMCALAQALHPDTGNQPLDRVALLSVGTGRNPKYLPQKDADWGIAQWASHLLSLTLEGSAGTADYQCRQILGERYLRIDPLLPEQIELDDVGAIDRLKEIAQREDLQKANRWVARYF